MLDLAAVVRHRHVALTESMELLSGLSNALDDVVQELRADRRPGGVGVVIRLVHGGEEIVGERGVEPGDEQVLI